MNNQELRIKIKHIIKLNKKYYIDSIQKQDQLSYSYHSGYIQALKNVLSDLEN